MLVPPPHDVAHEWRYDRTVGRLDDHQVRPLTVQLAGPAVELIRNLVDLIPGNFLDVRYHMDGDDLSAQGPCVSEGAYSCRVEGGQRYEGEAAGVPLAVIGREAGKAARDHVRPVEQRQLEPGEVGPPQDLHPERLGFIGEDDRDDGVLRLAPDRVELDQKTANPTGVGELAHLRSGRYRFPRKLRRRLQHHRRLVKRGGVREGILSGVVPSKHWHDNGSELRGGGRDARVLYLGPHSHVMAVDAP